MREKEEHIDSLKQVMQELTAHPEPEPELNEKEIEKKYNRGLYGTEAPNVVVTVQGGGGHKNEASPAGLGAKPKQSSLRKKVHNMRDAR